MSEIKLVCVLACRNSGSRLYGKPLQFLDISRRWSILDQVLANLSSLKPIQGTILAISEGSDNYPFIEYAKNNSLPYVIGDQEDVLSRLIKGAEKIGASHIFRVTSESPFLFKEGVEPAWDLLRHRHLDAVFLDDIIDGCGFEIIKINALRSSWINGNNDHRSELCTLFIRENRHLFQVENLEHDQLLNRKDLRLTVDYPEDLVVCRNVYEYLFSKNLSDNYRIDQIIDFLDTRPDLKALVHPYTESGYTTMYL